MTTMDPKALRAAFGRFLTGVTVVTARDRAGNPVGFTANSFSSVSLDPPLLLVCPGAFLSSYQVFETCNHFAVSVLAEGQEEVANTFAGFKGDRFAQVAHHPDVNNVLVMDGATARFSCSVHTRVPAGDHTILIGEVVDFAQNETLGLGYVAGQFFSLGLERAALETSTESTTITTICGAIIEDRGHVFMEQTSQGLQPLQTVCPDRAGSRRHLIEAMAARGAQVQLGQAYSVFDDAATGAHHTYYLANAVTGALPQGAIRVPVDALHTAEFATPAFATMMSRFARETQTRSFGLYLGDAVRGDVHTPNERF